MLNNLEFKFGEYIFFFNNFFLIVLDCFVLKIRVSRIWIID